MCMRGWEGVVQNGVALSILQIDSQVGAGLIFPQQVADLPIHSPYSSDRQMLGRQSWKNELQEPSRAPSLAE